MTIAPEQRRLMLTVPLCGPRVIARLESIGIRALTDLLGRDPEELVSRVNFSAGRPIWHPPMATAAMSNLIAAAARTAESAAEDSSAFEPAPSGAAARTGRHRTGHSRSQRASGCSLFLSAAR